MNRRPPRLIRRWGWTFDPWAYDDRRWPDPSLGSPTPQEELSAPLYADALPPDELRSNWPTWYQPETESWTPIPGLTVAPVAAQAALWQDPSRQQDVSRAERRYQPEDDELAPHPALGSAEPPVLAPSWPEQPGQERALWPTWYQPDGLHVLVMEPPVVPFDPTTVAAIVGLDPDLPARIGADAEDSWLEGAADDPDKPLGPATITSVEWGGGFASKWTIRFTWPAGLGPNDYAITYEDSGAGWTQNNNVYPDDYRNPSPAVDTFSTSQSADFVDVMVRMVRARASFPDPAFGVDPVMAIGDPVPAEAYGYATAVVRVYAIRPPTFAGELGPLAVPFVALPPDLIEPFTAALVPPFDPAPVVPALAADPAAPAAVHPTWYQPDEEIAEPALKHVGRATITGLTETVAPFHHVTVAFTWPAGLGFDDFAVVYVDYIDSTGTSMFGWTSTDTLFPADYLNPGTSTSDINAAGIDASSVNVFVRIVRGARIGAAFRADPVVAIGDPVPSEAWGYASLTLTAGLSQPGATAQADLNLIPPPALEFAPEASSEGLVPPTVAAFDPAIVAGITGLDGLARAAAWGALPEALAHVPIPGLTVATTEQIAAVLPEQPGQERDVIEVRFAGDAVFEVPRTIAPAFDPAPFAPSYQAGYDERPTDPRWYQELDDTLGVPPFAPTIASIAAQAALWPDPSGQQDRAIGPVWVVLDEPADCPPVVVITPPFDPVAIVPLMFDHEPPAATWGALPDPAMDGGLADWLFLSWGPPPAAGAGTAPAVLVDAESGDPFVYLGGAFIARAD